MLIHVCRGCLSWSRKSLQIAQFSYTTKTYKLERLYLLPSKILCIVAELPEVLRPKKKESSTFSVDGLPFGLVVFPGTFKWCRPSLYPASGKEC